MGLCALVWNVSSAVFAVERRWLISVKIQFRWFCKQGQLPTLGEVQGFLKIAFTDALCDNILWKTLPVRPNMTTKDVCELLLLASVGSLCLSCLSLLELPLFAWVAAFPCTCLMAILTHSPLLAFLFCFCDHAVDGKWMNDLPVCHWPIMYQFVTDQWCTNLSFTDKWCTSLSLMNGLPICLWPMIYETVMEEWSANLPQTSLWSG